MILERKIYKEMLDWKINSKGQTALLIEGARRVGKTKIATIFAQNEFDDYLLIDFSQVKNEVKDVFNDLVHLDDFFNTIFSFYNKKLKPGNTVIIFDEIQFFPRAREAIKFLVEDGRYYYIETGSLISIKKNVKDILLPSEEERIKMYPLDFEEFLWAFGNKETYGILKNDYDTLLTLPNNVAQIMTRKIREYMIVGGMPQAVIKYVETNSFLDAHRIKCSILELYRSDLAKYDIEEDGHTSKLFESIPSQLSSGGNSFKLSKAIKDKTHYDRYKTDWEFLNESMICNMITNVTDPRPGLALSEDNNTFKLYVGDIGLYFSMIFEKEKKQNENLFKDFFFGKLPMNKGSLYESLLAQIFVSNGHQPYYHIFTKQNAQTKTYYQIDFMFESGEKINIVEVKSSKRFTTSSLDLFVSKYKDVRFNSFVISPRVQTKKEKYTYIPVYYSFFL
jgi:hypothetical protein